MPGVCTLGDIAKTTVPHEHGCAGCPHVCLGPAISASANVSIGGQPALRVGDMGIHAACCGPNTWIVQEGSGQVFINGSASVSIGDKTLHCSIGAGKMQTGSGVVIDGSNRGGGLGNPFTTGAPAVVEVHGAPLNPMTNLSDEARAMLPCDHPLYRPPGGRPEQPHADAITPSEAEAMERQRLARIELAANLGIDVDSELDQEQERAQATLDHARRMVDESIENGDKMLRERQENLRRAEAHFEMIRAARGGRGGANVRGPRGR
jgi:uncharacterized Zn-binding protein involved in type VI secretion